MFRSEYCELARLNALSDKKNTDKDVQLLTLLDRKIADFETKKIQKRAKELKNLFDSFNNQQATRLLRRLKDKNDSLAKFYECELQTKFREKLLHRLERISEIDFLDRGIDDKGTTNKLVDVDTNTVPLPEKIIVDRPPPKKVDLPPPEKIIEIVDSPPQREEKLSNVEDILQEAQEVLEKLEEPKGIKQLNQLIRGAESLLLTIKSVSKIAGSLLFFGGTLYFINKYGKLISIAKGSGFLVDFLFTQYQNPMSAPRVVQRLLSELKDLEQKLTEIEEIRRNEQDRDSKGRFKRKSDSDSPGSTFEKFVCDLVQKRYPYHAIKVPVHGYTEYSNKPQYPRTIVDCIGSFSKTKNLILFEIKDSLTKPLRISQQIVKDRLELFGGEIMVSKGSFNKGTKLPKGTIIRVIRPNNLDDIRP